MSLRAACVVGIASEAISSPFITDIMYGGRVYMQSQGDEIASRCGRFTTLLAMTNSIDIQ